MYTRKSIWISVIIICITGSHCKKETSQALTVSNPTDGEILIAPYTSGSTASGQLLILDKYGSTLKERNTNADAFNFEKWNVNGKTRYTYLEHNTGAYTLVPNAITPCVGVVLDENMNEIKRVSLLSHNDIKYNDSLAIDSHEFIYLDDNHFITLTYYQKTVTNIPADLNPAAQCEVVTPIIQEVVNDNVVWQWEGADYPEFYRQSVEGNEFSNATVIHDYMHLNSIFIDPVDNNLICSIRNLNQLIKINHTTGNILWRLGGTDSNFPMTDEMKFLRQHHATLTDNNQTLLLYDNGEASERAYTRIDEFKLNEAQKNITSFKTFTLPGSVFSQFMGSVQKRGNTYFIGCGSEPKIMEVDYTTSKVNFLMKLSKSTYRAFKY